MFLNLLRLNLHGTLKVFRVFLTLLQLFKQTPQWFSTRWNKSEQVTKSLETAKHPLYHPCAAKLPEAHRQRGDCSESIHLDWLSEAWPSPFISKIKEFPEILNLLQLYSWAYTYKCVYIYVYVFAYMCLFIFNLYFFFFVCIYPCDANPDTWSWYLSLWCWSWARASPGLE